MLWLGDSLDTCCTWHKSCCQWLPRNVQGYLVPHPSYAGGLTAVVRLCGCGLLWGSRRQAAGSVHLRTGGMCESHLYEQLECAKAVAGMRVGSVGIHDDLQDQSTDTVLVDV